MLRMNNRLNKFNYMNFQQSMDGSPKSLVNNKELLNLRSTNFNHVYIIYIIQESITNNQQSSIEDEKEEEEEE